jgi:predicted lipid-binding transport protein (Tim44 family)
MSVSSHTIIIGIVLGVMLGGLIILWRRQYRDLFGAFLVLGVLTLAVVVTIYQVNQYREQQAIAAQIAQSQPVETAGSSSGPPAQPPVGARTLPPMAGGLRGAAAPAVVHAPPSAGNP